MSERTDGLGLAALMLASGILSRLQARGLLDPEETRVLIDSAITKLEAMPQDAMVHGAHYSGKFAGRSRARTQGIRGTPFLSSLPQRLPFPRGAKVRLSKFVEARSTAMHGHRTVPAAHGK